MSAVIAFVIFLLLTGPSVKKGWREQSFSYNITFRGFFTYCFVNFVLFFIPMAVAFRFEFDDFGFMVVKVMAAANAVFFLLFVIYASLRPIHRIYSRQDISPNLLKAILNHKVRKLCIHYQFKYLDDNPFHYIADQLTDIDFEIELSWKVKDLSCFFLDCVNLKSVRPFDTRGITNMTSMFQNCRSLVNAPELDMSDVTLADRMFYGCTSLESVPQYNTPKLTRAQSMFINCTRLRSIPRFDTHLFRPNDLLDIVNNVRIYAGDSISKKQRIDWNLINAVELNKKEDLTDENLRRLRNGSIELLIINYRCTRAPLPDETISEYEKWMRENNPFFRIREYVDDIRYKIEFSSSVSSLSHLFYGCIHLRSIKSIETKGITDFSFMFAPRHDPEKLFGFTGCSRLVRVPDMNTSSGKNFRGMFAGCSGLSTVPNLDLGNASDLSGMFASCSSLITVPPIRVFKSANMEGMFADCTALLTKPAVEKYAGAVQKTGGMFSGTGFDG